MNEKYLNQRFKKVTTNKSQNRKIIVNNINDTFLRLRLKYSHKSLRILNDFREKNVLNLIDLKPFLEFRIFVM